MEAGGWLPSAGQLIGAANRVKLESTIHDNQDTATVDLDPTVGLKDKREMSATLVTTAAGSDAAGFEGVSEGSTGDPRTGEPNPVPLPAVPEPATLQYVTVYSNGHQGRLRGLRAGLRTRRTSAAPTTRSRARTSKANSSPRQRPRTRARSA